MKELKTYRCNICGNLICMLEDSGVNPVCCGQPMTLVTANTEDAAFEKHVPVFHREGPDIQILVGEQPHPMTPQHHISFIFLLTDKGLYVRCLYPGESARAIFSLRPDENVISVYAWCNLHGMWKK